VYPGLTGSRDRGVAIVVERRQVEVAMRVDHGSAANLA
jgi:hypothetical protein